MAAVEDSSFWFQHRNNCILALIRKYPPRGEIFDIGAGNGYVAQGISDAGFSSVVVEPGPCGARAAKERGLKHVVCASLADAGFRQGSLPAVGLFDVVEHIEDDTLFMRDIYAVLADSGRVYATVPAYSWLWSAEDIIAGHYRRYTAGSIESLLTAAGFEIDYLTYIFRILPVPIFLLRALPSRFGFANFGSQDVERIKRDHEAGGGLTHRLIEKLLRSEPKIIEQAKVMKFGGSCLISATKK